ncbi:MAG: hypothetical protein Q8K32_07750 [Archangium sp.]|nr:hypothetical protein [Archangium sp.]
MTTTLLVLLVGELLTPFQSDLNVVLPLAFPGAVPEVLLGPNAPPGRTVAWVTNKSGGLEVEVVLHTARIAGDLRRLLRFTSSDAPRDRAKAVAFTLAAMMREREADLESLKPPAPQAPVLQGHAAWTLDASLFGGLDLPGLQPGGGLGVRLRRELVAPLQLGVGAEVGLFAAPSTTLVQPSFFVELAVPFSRGAFSTAAVVGGGVTAPILSRDGVSLTTWLPLLRVAAEGRLEVGPHHGFRFALTGHFIPSSLSVFVGEALLGTVGPAWVRPEVGYFAEL